MQERSAAYDQGSSGSGAGRHPQADAGASGSAEVTKYAPQPAPAACEPRCRSCYLSALELHELDEACQPILQAFGEYPYLVGSASQRPDFRDVDVRLILPDDEYDDLFGKRQGLWALMCRMGSTYLRARTGLPVDFQVQRQTEANEKFGSLAATPRNPLGRRNILNYAGGGDASG